MIIKTCTKCKEDKELCDFNNHYPSPFGKHPRCRVCTKVDNHINYIKYRPERLERQKIYFEENKDSVRESQAKYRESRRDELAEYAREYRKNNPEKTRETAYNYDKRMMKESPEYRLQKSIRRRLRSALQNKKKVGSAVKDLGCTPTELKQYLESKFKPGMTWQNHGSEWHIDHIRPLWTFDLENRDELLQACHFTNLQPLWATENLGIKKEQDKIKWAAFKKIKKGA